MDSTATLSLNVSARNTVIVTLGDEFETTIDGKNMTLYSITSIINGDVYYDTGYAPGALFYDIKDMDPNVLLLIDATDPHIPIVYTVRRKAYLDGAHSYKVLQKYTTRSYDSMMFQQCSL